MICMRTSGMFHYVRVNTRVLSAEEMYPRRLFPLSQNYDLHVHLRYVSLRAGENTLLNL